MAWGRSCVSALGLAFGVACSGTPEPVASPPEPDRKAALAAAEAQAQAVRTQAGVSEGSDSVPAVVPRDGVAPPVLFVWDNVGDLYQSFFLRTEAVTALSEALTGYANGPVNVHIRWDQEAFLGTIRLRILPDTLILPELGNGNTVPLQSLAPLTTALASYRSDVASRFDVRVASFRVSLESFAGARHCVFPIAGTPPPDGRVVSPCVLLNGQERCGTPEAEGVVFAPDVAADLRACLTPKG
jgi:hypothetical protein